MFTVVRGGETVEHEIAVTGGSLTMFNSGLLYCTSLANTDELFASMVDKFGIDAAFEIADIDEFARLILALLSEAEPHLQGAKADIQRLRDKPEPDPEFQAAMLRYHERELEHLQLLTMQVGPVSYYDTSPADSVADMPGVDPFSKPSDYAWQREHRIVITPFECGDGVDVEMPALCELIRIVR